MAPLVLLLVCPLDFAHLRWIEAGNGGSILVCGV